MKTIKKILKFYTNKYIYLIPIIMLLATLYSIYFKINYVVVGNVLGCSILTNIAMYYFFNFKGNYCWFTKNVPLCLITINLIDIIGYFIEYKKYNTFFNLIVISMTVVFYIIYKVKNINKKK